MTRRASSARRCCSARSTATSSAWSTSPATRWSCAAARTSLHRRDRPVQDPRASHRSARACGGSRPITGAGPWTCCGERERARRGRRARCARRPRSCPRPWRRSASACASSRRRRARAAAAATAAGPTWPRDGGCARARPAQGARRRGPGGHRSATRCCELADRLRGQLGPSAVVLGARDGERVQLVASITPEAVEAGLDAAAVIRPSAPIVGGGGGGRPAMARAGGKDASRLDEALDAARSLLAEPRA